MQFTAVDAPRSPAPAACRTTAPGPYLTTDHIGGSGQYENVVEILKKAGVEAKFKVTRDGFLIFTRGPEVYKQVQDSMKQCGITGHWHQHKADRQLRNIIKGIPEKVSTGEVKKQRNRASRSEPSLE